MSVETGDIIDLGVVYSTLIFNVKYCKFLHLKMDKADGTTWVLRIWTHQFNNALLLDGRQKRAFIIGDGILGLCIRQVVLVPEV